MKCLKGVAIPGMNTVVVYTSGYGKLVVNDDIDGTWKLEGFEAASGKRLLSGHKKLIRDPKRGSVKIG